MNNSWIKLYSKFLNWKWYKNHNTKIVFIHCLLKANWKNGTFEDVDVQRGSFITSLPKLAEELNMSVQSIRTSIKHLKSTGEITVKTFPKFSMITVNNYNEFQMNNSIINTLLTGDQQAINSLLTTIEEYKNNRILNNKKNNARVLEEIFDYDWIEDYEER